jgi:hypothetical protein
MTSLQACLSCEWPWHTGDEPWHSVIVAVLSRPSPYSEGASAALAEYLESGQMSLLRGLQGHAALEDLFTTRPGFGRELARRLHTELGACRR